MVTVREAVENDCEAIYGLNKNSLGYDYDIGKTREFLTCLLSDKNHAIFASVVDGAVVGYIHACRYETVYFDPLVNIMLLAVDENKRRLGAGKALLNSTEDWAKRIGAAGVRLSSNVKRTEAHKFYLACGYLNIAEHKSFRKTF